MKNKPHVLLFPFPAQGHTNPIFQFAKRLASKGLKTTLATTIYLAKSFHIKPGTPVGIETISDGFDETGAQGAPSGDDYLDRFVKAGSESLRELIKKYENTPHPVTCLVHDAICPWALDVGKEFGLVGATFYTQACNVCCIFYQVKIGKVNFPVDEAVDTIPGMPLLQLEDLPTSLLHSDPPDTAAFGLLTGQFAHPDKADWLFFNTFDHLETEMLKLMTELWPHMRAIGPTAPSMYLDKRVEGDTENSLNFFKPTDATSYIKWLNTKEAKSVIYISFGSIAALELAQMEELVSGIAQSEKSFFWVVRESERTKLPTNFTTKEGEGEVWGGKGLIVSWCSQMQVLAHEAIGCFVTHCGWNSTMEALSLGVPMVAMPYIWDQPTVAKFVEDVWGVGIRVRVDSEKKMVTREEVEFCIREVMDGERGKVIKMNANRWSELAKNAIDVGGTSDVNIDEFVASLP